MGVRHLAFKNRRVRESSGRLGSNDDLDEGWLIRDFKNGLRKVDVLVRLHIRDFKN
jgi:hypothetical protein